MQPVFIVLAVAAVLLVGCVALALRLVWRASALEARHAKGGAHLDAEHLIRAEKVKQQKIAGDGSKPYGSPGSLDYYVVAYEWTDEKGERQDYACRMLRQPPDTLLLRRDGRRVEPVGDVVLRTDTDSDPFIRGGGRFNPASYLLLLAPVVIVLAAVMVLKLII